MPPWTPAWKSPTARRGRVGWEMKEGLTLYLGPGDLSLHPMDCCAHSTLRFPLGYYEGFSISLNPDTLSQALPPALALGGVSPQEILRRFCPQGHPMSLPAQTALDHISLRSTICRRPSACLTTR